MRKIAKFLDTAYKWFTAKLDRLERETLYHIITGLIIAVFILNLFVLF